MDIGWLVSYFLNPGPELIITLVQLALGLILGFFVKRMATAIIGVFAVLLAAYLIGVLSLPETILIEVQALLGDAAGRIASALLLMSPFALGLIAGVVLGAILL